MIDIVRMKGAAAQRAEGTLWPAQAMLDRAVLQNVFARLIEEKLREVASNRAYAYGDDCHSDEIAKSDVYGIVGALRESGFRIKADDVDAMLSQYLRTGIISDVVLTATGPDGTNVAIPIEIDAGMPPVPKEGSVFGHRVVERGPGMWLVSSSGDSSFSLIHLTIVLPKFTYCSCETAACKHVAAVRRHLESTVPVSGRPCAFEKTAKGERLNRALRLAGTFGIFAPLPANVRKGRPDIALSARALAIILRLVLGREYEDETSVNVRALVQAGVYSTRLPHYNTLRRFRRDKSVLRLLTRMRAEAARPLVERGLLSNDAFCGDRRDAAGLAADIASCLDIAMTNEAARPTHAA